MKLKCYAIDDEPLALDLISDNVKRIHFLEYIGGNTSASKGLEFLLANQVDLLFLDIQMPKLTGVEIAKKISSDTLVIFTTAYDRYAVTGFELNAVDYVLKPIDFLRFEKACQKAREVAEWRMGKEREKFIFVNAEHTLVRILLRDILYIEGLKDYVKIHLKGQSKPVLTRLNLKAMEARLPSNDFIRIHKSFIVNKRQVAKFSARQITVGEVEIPVGDTYKNDFRDLLGA